MAKSKSRWQQIVTYFVMANAVFARPCTAQQPLQWQYTHIAGGGSDDSIFGLDLNQDASGWMVGYTTGFGASISFPDMLVMPFRDNGTLVDPFTLSASADDFLFAVKRITDDHYAIAGSSESDGAGNLDAFYGQVQIINGNPSLFCAKLFGGSNDDEFKALTVAADSSVYAAGYSRSAGAGNNDFLAFKFDSDCNVVWRVVLGSTGDDKATTISLTPDQMNVIVCGTTTGFESVIRDWLCISLDAATGSTINWAADLDSGGSDNLAASAVSTDGSLLFLGGDTNAFSAVSRDMMLAALRINNGSAVGAWRISQTGNGLMGGIAVDEDNQVYFTGYNTAVPNGPSKSIVVGSAAVLQDSLQWIHYLGDRLDNFGRAITLDAQGGPVVAGNGESFGAQNFDATLLRFNHSGGYADCATIDASATSLVTLDISDKIALVDGQVQKDNGFSYTETNISLTLNAISPDEDRICEAATEIPQTDSPTTSPTAAPTVAPTAAPTVTPTTAPTAPPSSAVPTAAPTPSASTTPLVPSQTTPVPGTVDAPGAGTPFNWAALIAGLLAGIYYLLSLLAGVAYIRHRHRRQDGRNSVSNFDNAIPVNVGINDALYDSVPGLPANNEYQPLALVPKPPVNQAYDVVNGNSNTYEQVNCQLGLVAQSASAKKTEAPTQEDDRIYIQANAALTPIESLPAVPHGAVGAASDDDLENGDAIALTQMHSSPAAPPTQVELGRASQSPQVAL